MSEQQIPCPTKNIRIRQGSRGNWYIVGQTSDDRLYYLHANGTWHLRAVLFDTHGKITSSGYYVSEADAQAVLDAFGSSPVPKISEPPVSGESGD